MKIKTENTNFKENVSFSNSNLQLKKKKKNNRAPSIDYFKYFYLFIYSCNGCKKY